MKHYRIFVGLLFTTVLPGAAVLGGDASGGERSLPGAPIHAPPIGSLFTYQGYLEDVGEPANGTYDFEFELWDDAVSGSQVGSTLTLQDVTVTDGVFTVALAFGDVFNGEAFWLAIHIRPGASTGGYQPLLPRQPLTPVPYASYAMHIPLAGIGKALEPLDVGSGLIQMLVMLRQEGMP